MRALAVGRLVRVKNFHLLVEAWSSVESSLRIVGDGPEKSSLQRTARDLKLLDKIEFTGERQDVPQLMREADVLISPSVREGFSYVVLEALQAELVVISSRTGIASELVPDVCLLDEVNATAIAKTVNEVAASLDEFKQRFSDAWKSARACTVERMVQETESVYERVLTSRT